MCGVGLEVHNNGDGDLELHGERGEGGEMGVGKFLLCLSGGWALILKLSAEPVKLNPLR